MRHEGDVARAREFFFRKSPQNLKLLVQGRYEWMNEFIGTGDVGLEVGCGAGIGREYIRAGAFYLSDVCEYDWLDYQHVDALNTPFADEQFDFVVASNMVHHLAHPMVFFREMHRILRPHGKLLIQEINGSLAMRLLLRLMRHEGYSYDVNVFDEQCVCNDPGDPWSANCVIPNLLWDDRAKFQRHMPALKMVHHRFRECSTLLNSGGVIAKTRCIPMPRWMVRMMQVLDTAVITLFPHVFALQRQIVLEKQSRLSRDSVQPASPVPVMKSASSCLRPRNSLSTRAA
jgi:hypothetical protein